MNIESNRKDRQKCRNKTQWVTEMQFNDCIKRVVREHDIGQLRKAYIVRHGGNHFALKHVDEYVRQFILSNAKKVYTAHFEHVARKNVNTMPYKHMCSACNAARNGQFSTARDLLRRYGVSA